MNFKTFSTAVFNRMTQMETHEELLRVNVTGDDLWDTYLQAFPKGSNPVFRERTEHDCNCCKQFIRKVGGLVVYGANGELMSIWDVKIKNEPEYQVVADTMSAFVKSKVVAGVFRSTEKTIGTVSNVEILTGTVWNHFHYKFNTTKFLVSKDEHGTLIGRLNTNYQTFKRSLEEITEGSIETVLDLIKQNSIYRGTEHKPVVEKLRLYKKAYSKARSKEAYLWNNYKLVPNNIRGTVIGTLLVDLSEAYH